MSSGTAVCVACGEPERSILPMRPTPLQALTVTFESPVGEPCTLLVRRWEAGAELRCQLCSVCNAKVGAEGQAVCVVSVCGEAPNGTRALW